MFRSVHPICTDKPCEMFAAKRTTIVTQRLVKYAASRTNATNKLSNRSVHDSNPTVIKNAAGENLSVISWSWYRTATIWRHNRTTHKAPRPRIAMGMIRNNSAATVFVNTARHGQRLMTQRTGRACGLYLYYMYTHTHTPSARRVPIVPPLIK